VVRTFIDADVLIFAARGIGEPAKRAMDILSDPDREFVSSIFLKLEVLPKARYYSRDIEAQFYQLFFGAVTRWITPSAHFTDRALKLAEQFGLSAMDALHLTAAEHLRVDEFVTGEKPSSPMFRVPNIRIVSLFEKS
jgi:predicted nucleic acid-binding protein